MCGVGNCMSLDIGGTTADIALIVDGKPQFATGEYIGEFQVHIPSVSVSSVGEGGGSVAWVDELGVLKVGPDSAGSTPGPACYGRGGTRPTITDAYAVLGVIGGMDLGYNAVQIDTDAARRAVAPLAETLGLSLLATAEAIVDVAVSSMYSGVSRVISRFGIDPREFALMPFGGAGPMMACYLAKALSMPRLLVPTTPGVLSALGGLVADIKNDFVATIYSALDDSTIAGLSDVVTGLERQARNWLRGETGDESGTGADVALSAEMRYHGQSFEIDTPLQPQWLADRDLDAIRAAFHTEHERIYGHADAAGAVQIVAVRLVIVARTPKPELCRIESGSGNPQALMVKPIFMEGQLREVPVYQRRDLLAGQSFAGPAIVAQDDTTTCVLPGFQARVDAFGNLELVAAAQ
jgi:N-methylhydantoinase A